MEIVSERTRIFSFFFENDRQNDDFFPESSIFDDQGSTDPSSSSSFTTFKSNFFVNSKSNQSSMKKRNCDRSFCPNEQQEYCNIDYENTYLYSDETSRFDEIPSLTSITSNIVRELSRTQADANLPFDNSPIHSDSEDTSQALQLFDDENSVDQSLSLPEESGVYFYSKSSNGFDQSKFSSSIRQIDFTDIENSINNKDKVNQAQTKISLIDELGSLNISMMTSSTENVDCHLTFTGEQLDRQNENQQQTNDDEHHRSDVDSIQSIRSSTMISDDDLFIINPHPKDSPTNLLIDQSPFDETQIDHSLFHNHNKYSIDSINRENPTEVQNKVDRKLRDKVISITRVHCKKRQTWIRSFSCSDQNFSIDHFKSSEQLRPIVNNETVESTDVLFETNCNQAMNSTTKPNKLPMTAPAIGSQKNPISKNKNNHHLKHGQTPFYDFVTQNRDQNQRNLIKTSTSSTLLPSSPLKTNTSDNNKDVSSSSNKRTSNFYLIHQQSSIIPVKDLLKDNLHPHIEVIQMDEKDCVLEIVDGALTVVPKDKSNSSSITEDSEQNYPTEDHHEPLGRIVRSSSIASSISTPPLSADEQEHEENSLSSSLRDERNAKPFILQRESPIRSSVQEQNVDLLDLFSTPPVANSQSNHESQRENVNNILDDSLSSVSSHEQENAANQLNFDLFESEAQTNIVQSSPSSRNQSKSSSPSPSMKDEISSSNSNENQTSNTRASVLNELVQTVNKQPSIDESESQNISEPYPLPKSEPPPVAKPLNKARINEFATLLSSCVHLSQTPVVQKTVAPKVNPVVVPSPVRSEDQSQSFASLPSATSDREERESYHTVQSNSSDSETKKKHFDASYNEKLDDRGSIQVKTANIKALFEQKISDTNRTTSTQSNEHSQSSSEHRPHQHKKIPVSFDSLRKNLPPTGSNSNSRRTSFQDPTAMNKYVDHALGAKEVVIEEKQPTVVRPIQQYGTSARRNNTDVIIRSAADSAMTSPVASLNLFNSESLIAREIRETKEKEEELKRQRKKCGLAMDANALLTFATNGSNKTSNSNDSEAPARSSSFLSNLDFFTSKANSAAQETQPLILASPRRSSLSINTNHSESAGIPSNNGSRQSSADERKQLSNLVSHELSRLNDIGVPVVRTNSTANILHRSSSNQNFQQTQSNSSNNIIQREIEAIRAREAELRQMGRIQNTSDAHSDPKKYQEHVSTLPKSQSVNTISTGKIRRDSDRSASQITPTSSTLIRSKPPTPSPSTSSIRGKFPSPSPTAPIVGSSLKSVDYSTITGADRLEMEKREAREREQELRRQRHSMIGTGILSVNNNNHANNNATNGDSGHVSPDDQDDDQERYFDKLERFKRTETEKAQAPLIRPTKKSNLSQKWEQMIANKSGANGVGDDN